MLVQCGAAAALLAHCPQQALPCKPNPRLSANNGDKGKSLAGQLTETSCNERYTAAFAFNFDVSVHGFSCLQPLLLQLRNYIQCILYMCSIRV